MSFGFSVGDILTASGLVVELYKTLQDSDYSSYKDFSSELELLDRALTEASEMAKSTDHTLMIDLFNAVSFEANECRRRIKNFFEKTEKFRKSQEHQTNNGLKSTWMRIHFQMFRQDDIQQLRDSLRQSSQAIILILGMSNLYWRPLLYFILGYNY